MPSHPTVIGLIRDQRGLLPVIAAGGAVGSLARWAIAQAVPHHGHAFPTGTFVTNVSGALLIGVLMTFVLGPWSHTRYLRPFLGVGLLGGYTTFSTYELEARGLLGDGAPLTGFGYLAISVVAGLLAVAVGVVAGRVLIATGVRRHRREVSQEVSQPDRDAGRLRTDTAPQED